MTEECPQFIGQSAALRTVLEDVESASQTNVKVLISGESGVGKEVAARLIHTRSARRHAPLVTINCAGFPDSLLESELFGHVRGSFTGAHRDRAGRFERAHGGTVFMDEVGEMSLRMQALLLRFVETGELQRLGADVARTKCDVRIIAATNRDLTAQIAAKEFREDLFYRLNVMQVRIPPLRERREDIPALLAHFFMLFAEMHRMPVLDVAPETMDLLVAYDWPGNVRQLRNVVERMVVRVRSGALTADDVPQEIAGSPSRGGSAAHDRPGALIDGLIARMLRGESFWTVVYGPFMKRDLKRDDVQQVVAKGLQRTQGSYKLLTDLFRIRTEDYKRFLNFLRKHDCHVAFQRFRVIEGGRENAPAEAVNQ
jgi:transcriptional regulator with PAS, ATPase and Fis domain